MSCCAIIKSYNKRVFTQDPAKQISNANIEKYLSPELRRIVTWIDADADTQKKLKGVGFEQSHGKLVKANNSDGEVLW